MKFVFSSWYIVIAVLVVAIVVLTVFLVRMDKQDKVIIDEFAKNSGEAEAKSTDTAKTEVKVDKE